ncbi:MAG: hypothetical protein ACTSR2_07055 [Candidatus Hodarchaeales archaeon]
MEALKHTEWVFGMFFIWFALFGMKFNPEWFIIVLIGSQIPDFLELLLLKIGMRQTWARKFTHDYAIVIILWFIFPFRSYPEMNLFTTAVSAHFVVDLFSGLEPIYIAGFIFGERTAILYVTAEHRMIIGKKIENWGSDYLITENEEPTPELAWFWVMQLSGTMFCGIAVIIYLIL